nr:MAG TPA: hypothetical protein [Caudoviricetes sp.]
MSKETRCISSGHTSLLPSYPQLGHLPTFKFCCNFNNCSFVNLPIIEKIKIRQRQR